ncbi:MAG: right-handed parallel beta-helix repeat-containing protein [Spirosomaceae bacterium]|nr:right-handed parallel beta-helix repeat-containing protein [Spirosomataceae bacterium]
MKKSVHITLLFFAITTWSCSNDSNTKSVEIGDLPKANTDQIEELVAAFIEAEDGITIEIPEGFYELNTQLILDAVNNVTVKGAGMRRSVLSFKTLTTGGEGMKIAGNNITLEGFTVIDAPGDDIKTQHCDGITFRDVNTTWTHTDLAKSGTYGIYPVQCNNVLIEKCEVSHSRDAGIYVGQSTKIIVRNNYVFENVAGIEIENSDNAIVHDNHAENNTGGILVFNLPGLPKAWGRNTKIYNNLIKDNNHENFALGEASENGNPISMIPPGSGVVIFAGDSVEVFNNQIINHKTASVSIASYQITDLPIPTHEGWSPYVKNVFIHGNTYEREFGVPDVTKELGKLVAAKCFKSQDVLYDGIVEGKATSNPNNICVNETLADLRFARFIIPSGKISEISVENDIQNFKCN